MFPNITWQDITLRLVLTLVAGALIGINRGEHTRPAGLRTTMLVCLAASLSMIQVNLLLAMHGKQPDSFAVMDLMRLPLGILSGMGFIGAGAILRRENLVMGVTTAATLWFVTVIGICIGGGQWILGSVATGAGIIVLWGLKPVEHLWKRDRQAHLTVIAKASDAMEKEVIKHIHQGGCKLGSMSVIQEKTHREMRFTVRWRTTACDHTPPNFVNHLLNDGQYIKVAWEPELIAE